MADALKLLREYTMEKKEIVERDGQIFFGDVSFPNDMETKYQRMHFQSDRDGTAKEYYTLGSMLFLLRNVHLLHPAYCRLASEKKIVPIKRPDRKNMLAYLTGEKDSSNSIDENVGGGGGDKASVDSVGKRSASPPTTTDENREQDPEPKKKRHRRSKKSKKV